MSALFFLKVLKFFYIKKAVLISVKLRFLLILSLYVGVVPEIYALTTDKNSSIGSVVKKANLEVWGILGVNVVIDDSLKSGDIIARRFLYESDSRLKRDIKPLDQALENTLRLQGVSYHWQDSAKGTNQQIGLIAQQVEQVYPQLVSTGSAGHKSVHYGNLVAILIEAIKQQQQQISSQQQQIDKLNKLIVENKTVVSTAK